MDFIHATRQEDGKTESKLIDIAELAGSGEVWEQVTPSDTWDITHRLKKPPSVTVVDSAGMKIEGRVTYPEGEENTRVIVKFKYAFGGRAFLN